MSHASLTQGPKPAPEPAFFENPAIDNLITVTLELGAELWAQRERARILELVLARRGLAVTEEIERYELTPEERAAQQGERDAFVSRLYGAFARVTVPATSPAA
jgi:hypothetical protein